MKGIVLRELKEMQKTFQLQDDTCSITYQTLFFDEVNTFTSTPFIHTGLSVIIHRQARELSLFLFSIHKQTETKNQLK